MPTKAKGSSGARAASKRPAARKAAAPKAPAGKPARTSADIVAEQLPGWKLAPELKLRSPGLDTEGDMKIETGPSIAQLRRKFLGGGDADDAAADDSTILANVDRRVKTVRIEPKTGGPAKTADIRGGKITIVQG